MGVSATGARRRPISRLGSILAGVAVLVATAFYVYGPPVTPTLRSAAAEQCNEIAGGSYRHYRLAWVVGVRPHWSCRDSRDRSAPSRDLGWWVAPD